MRLVESKWKQICFDGELLEPDGFLPMDCCMRIAAKASQSTARASKILLKVCDISMGQTFGILLSTLPKTLKNPTIGW